MAGRRVVYIALLFTAALYHFAYGQYATYYMLLFLLCLPILSLLLCLPSALTSRVSVNGGTDVYRNADVHVELELTCGFILPPETWLVTVEEQNLFIDKTSSKQNLRFRGAGKIKKSFFPDTSHLGTIRYHIKKARVYDYLGLFSIPVRRRGAAEFTVLPNMERPEPMPEFDDPASIVFKPKPLGFSEEHELRPYRNGDPLNLVHWKLSVKMDDLIVREPQEVIRRKIALCVDLPALYEDQQSIIEQLRYLSEELIGKEIPYQLVFGSQVLTVSSNDELIDFIKAYLGKPMQAQRASGAVSGTNTIVCRIYPSGGTRA